jgi:hypothetical protein
MHDEMVKREGKVLLMVPWERPPVKLQVPKSASRQANFPKVEFL